MGIKKDYKQTEIGTIPEDWGIEVLEALCPQNGLVRGPFGGSLKKEFFVHSGYKVYEQRNAIYRDAEIGTYYVDTAKYNELRRFSLQEGDFIVSCSGTIGRIFQMPKGMQPGIINQALLKIKTDNNKISAEFFFYYFDWEKFRERIIDNTQGGAMQNLVGMSVFRKILIPLPSQPEQHLIAAALSDVDVFLTVQNDLIAKKRLIKQGAMQELLTGKKRLPGFSEEWIVKKLGEISEIKTGKKNNEDKVENGAYPFFVRSQTVERINTYSFDGEAILIPGEGGIGSIFHYINGKFDYHQRVYKISNFSEDTCGKFIYFTMVQHFNEQAMRNTVKATVDSLRLPTFLKFEFPAPPSHAEQTAIAEILSDMDAEIAALEARREKTRLLKQGMMQELLTGRIRLI
jgi:type I restriction enzyme S subunit